MATVTGSTYDQTQYIGLCTTLQLNCNDFTLIVYIVDANEMNCIGMICVDMGYVYIPPVTAAIFDLTLIQMLNTSSAVLVNLDNVGVIFRISLLSIIDAEILRYFVVTSGNGGHL
jgi:hypothetical protein